MLKQFFFSLMILGAILLTACQENSTTAPAGGEQDLLISKTSSMTKGKVTILSVIKNDDLNHWEVKVDMPGDGGVVKFEYFLGSNDLRQIKGLTPSFEYEIDPGNGLLNYSAAKEIALGAVSGSILEWKLEKDESDNNWQYRFDIGTAEVRIDAVSGNILKIKN